MLNSVKSFGCGAHDDCYGNAFVIELGTRLSRMFLRDFSHVIDLAFHTVTACSQCAHDTSSIIYNPPHGRNDRFGRHYL